MAHMPTIPTLSPPPPLPQPCLWGEAHQLMGQNRVLNRPTCLALPLFPAKLRGWGQGVVQPQPSSEIFLGMEGERKTVEVGGGPLFWI